MWSHIYIYVHCAEKVLQTMDLAPFVLVNGNISIYTDLCMFQVFELISLKVFEFRYIISPTHFSHFLPLTHCHTLATHKHKHTLSHSHTHTLHITHTHSLTHSMTRTLHITLTPSTHQRRTLLIIISCGLTHISPHTVCH